MKRRVLLDTNLLIKALDQGSSTDPEERQLAKQRLAELLTDDSVRFAITPLIRYEFLRKVGWDDYERYQTLEASLKEFQEFIIDKDVSDIATGLYRLDAFESASTNSDKNIDKRKFDTFHLAVAKCNDLELASDDSDIAKLEPLYERLIEERVHLAKDNTNNEENT